jgi:hypothetical protein
VPTMPARDQTAGWLLETSSADSKENPRTP